MDIPDIPAGTYNVSAAESESIYVGISANKTVEDQLKVVQGAPPELQSAVHYDNGTDAEVELAFDENVSAVRTLNVSTVGGDANLTESVSVSDGRVVATLDGVYAEDLEVAYDVTDDVGNTYATDRTTAVRFAAVTTTVGDDDTVYAGPTLAVLTNRTNESVDIDATDSTVGRSASTGANSKVYLVDTGTLDPGAYEVVYGGEGNRNATFGVESLGLAVGVNDATVTNADGSAVAGTVSANASDRSVAVELRGADENTVATDDAVLDGRGEYDYAFDASDLAAGDYAVVAVDGVSGAENRSKPVVVSNPQDDDDDDSEYSDYRDPTATPSPTPTERTTTGAGPLTESSNGTATDGAVSVEEAEGDATADGTSATAEETRFETANATTDAATPSAAAPAARSESDSETTTGTEVPGFGVGAAVAALFLGASLAVLAVHRDR